FVSAVSHDPRVAVAVLQEMLAPYVHSGKIQLPMQHRIVAAETHGDKVAALRAEAVLTGDQCDLSGSYLLDATDCGAVLPLAGIEYVTGAESAAETGEPHALQGAANPMDMQAFTYCFAMDYIEGEDHT